MKQLIVLTATVMLGIFLFTLIAGSQDGSIYSALRGVWVREAASRTMVDGRL
ncbi:MAG: hypothetical protein II689_04300 [Firmicutes bacterium]|jgi:hypothetical protein|nr:hypothetical protein [Bacillota bacterium]